MTVSRNKRKVVFRKVEFWLGPEESRRLREVSAGFGVESQVVAKAMFSASLSAFMLAPVNNEVCVGKAKTEEKGVSNVGRIIEGILKRKR